jgi:transcriptional regulator with XRE-family HTH domain
MSARRNQLVRTREARKKPMTPTLQLVNERSLRQDVGVRIREWRLRRELSQAEVAREAGITQASLSNYENGKRDMPLSTLVGVASALNVSIGDVLDLPEMIVVRDSILGRAVEQLQQRVPVGTGTADAAS